MVLEAVEHDMRLYTREDFSDLRVAFIHYWLVTWRGGEKVLKSMLKLFPKADVYTLFFDENNCRPHLGSVDVTTSCLDYPFLQKCYKQLFPFYPLGIKSLTLKGDYDLIISSESGPAKGISNPSGVPHLCYIHSPMRYCWGYTDIYLKSMPKWSRRIAKWRFKKLANWDLTTVDNVDAYVANSQNVVNRVKSFYSKKAEICYPPIALDLFDRDLVDNLKEHYLSFGAITPYKNVRLLVETFNKLGKKLVVIGTGSEKKKLERLASKNIAFLGKLNLDEVTSYIQKSKALLFPGDEDFGMVPLEVMSQGIPVIAFKKGGALETVVQNEHKPQESSGLFFDHPTIDSLTDAISRFEELENEFDPVWIRNHARKFGEDHFQFNIGEHILDLLNKKSRTK